jgi:manganese/zinc/iron transport system substrate-binding protein
MALLPAHQSPTLSRRRAIAMAAVVVTLPLLPHSARATAQSDPIRVTATVGMVADAVKNVGGDLVDVTTLMGPGIDPHLYKPSANDIDALGDTDIIFYGGLHLEGRMAELLEKIPSLGIPTIGVGDHTPPEKLRTPPEFSGNPDPHIWFSVPLWQIAVDIVRDALMERYPDRAETFEANTAAYQEELGALDAYVREQTATVPEDVRVLVTAHDAFGYFGEEYGYEVHGIQGFSTATEAGAGDIQDLTDMIVTRRIPAIFVESSIPPSTIEALREACRSRGWDVAIGGELFSDAMGETGTFEGTYIGMVTHNIDTIVAGLTGVVEPDH